MPDCSCTVKRDTNSRLWLSVPSDTRRTEYRAVGRDVRTVLCPHGTQIPVPTEEPT